MYTFESFSNTIIIMREFDFVLIQSCVIFDLTNTAWTIDKGSRGGIECNPQNAV